MPTIPSDPPPGTHQARHDAPSGLLSITAAAQHAGVSRWTVAGWIKEGTLPAVRIDRRRYVRPQELAAAQAAAHLGDVVPAWRADRMHAGSRLRTLREAAGLTQLALAAASGLTHEALSNLETGKRAPLVATVTKLAQALHVAPSLFVSQEPLGLTMLTSAEAAFRLDVPVGRVQTWLQQGELSGVKVSGQWRVPAVAVAALGSSGRLRGHSRRLDPRYRG